MPERVVAAGIRFSNAVNERETMSDDTEMTPPEALALVMQQPPFAALAAVRVLLDEAQQAALDDIIKTVIAKKGAEANTKLASLHEQAESRWQQLKEAQFAHELQWHNERTAELDREIRELHLLVRAAATEQAPAKKRRSTKS
jgi:hypothetical protein